MKAYIGALVLLAASLPAAAQAPAPVDPVLNLAFSDLPPEQVSRIANAATSYGLAARAWWIETRCHLAQPGEADTFEKNLAGFTDVMRSLIQEQLKMEPQKAQEYTERIQMHALNQMSAAKFYDCGDRAKAIHKAGYDEAERLANFLKNRQQKPQ